MISEAKMYLGGQKIQEYKKIFLADCFTYFYTYLQWLPEQMECRNAQIGKPAVSLWIPMIQK